MKDRELICPDGISYVIQNVPEYVEQIQLELHLVSGKMRELEELGLYIYEYATLISENDPVLPELSDYMQAMVRTYPNIRYHMKEFVHFETGADLDLIECWLQGEETIPKSARDKLKEFILKGKKAE